MAVSDEIKNEIKAIYNADVTAIQNLSDIANKLQTGGYTCPGDYTVTGKMTVNGALNVGGAVNVSGAINTGSTMNVGGNLTINQELLIDHDGHECHFFNRDGLAGIWYHKKGEGAKTLYFDGGIDSGFLYGSEINALKARCDALENKTQNITTDTNASQTVFKGSAKIPSGVFMDNGAQIHWSSIAVGSGDGNEFSAWGGHAGEGRRII